LLAREGSPPSTLRPSFYLSWIMFYAAFACYALAPGFR